MPTLVDHSGRTKLRGVDRSLMKLGLKLSLKHRRLTGRVDVSYLIVKQIAQYLEAFFSKTDSIAGGVLQIKTRVDKMLVDLKLSQ